PGRRRRRTSPRSSLQRLPQLAQPDVEALTGELEVVQRRCDREHRKHPYAEREELGRGHVRPALVERDRVDEALRQADRKDADRDQRDTEQRVNGAEIRALRTGGKREAEHEVSAIEQEQNEEEDELVFTPHPPVPPAVARPYRPGH